MDIKALFLACRSGDLSKVEYLVDKEVVINVRDKWDSSPLFYACLCGHEDIVQFLLENGAKCEANTFDGERCLYGSLTNTIRSMIKNYKQVTSSTMRREAYIEFLRKLQDSGMYSDVEFDVHGHRFPAHRCILASRSQFFAEMFRTRWKDRLLIKLSKPLLYHKAFKAVLQWLYTLRFEIEIDDVHSVSLLAKQCQLLDLEECLKDKMRHVTSFQAAKPGVRVTIVSVEPTSDNTTLQDSLITLADRALPLGLFSNDLQLFPFKPDQDQLHPDIIYSVEGHRFTCHKAFFHCRSDYFRALEIDHFGEQCGDVDSDSGLPVIRLNGVVASVFMQIVFYLYTDQCELNENNVFDVLYIGDLYLLPGLKRYCSNMISKCIDVDNVVSFLRTARLFNLPRLENDCAAFIANNLDTVLQDEEFAQFVLEDARAVVQRQETDSITIIDDVRYHITTEKVHGFSDLYEADRELNIIERFLLQLGLDA